MLGSWEGFRPNINFSTVNHPQIDCQIEMINSLVEEYLKHYITESHKKLGGLA